MGILDSIKPQSAGQQKMLEALKNENYSIVGIFGPTGTGKSLFSLAYGIDAVMNNKYRRLIVVKPMIDVTTGEELTMAKAGPQFLELAKQYVIDVIGNFISWEDVSKLMNDGKVMFVDSHYLKGRTFDEAVVFIDDAQTLKLESLIETIVRVGRNSRLIVAADPIFQALRGKGATDPSAILRDILAGEQKAIVVDLGVKDIVRAGARIGLRLIMEYMLRSRKLKESELKALEIIRMRSPDADVITLLDLEDLVKKYHISSEHVPKYLVIVKQGHLGRLVGKKGERVNAIEKDLSARVRGVELDIDLTNIIRAVHPVSWVWKRVEDVDFMGSYITISIDEGAFGPFMGQKGVYVRFLDEVMRELFGIGVRVVPTESRRGKRRK
ncbi:MAG: phosphate starvation-inducible protein PhoH [Desulfurococcales archaeon ex4484_42]|nr:MAG: phosphate starvation-inducible protein PhoH [Desulfurococcales archaeon ex4484_42]